MQAINKIQKKKPDGLNTTVESVDIISTLTYCVDILDHMQRLYADTKPILHTSNESPRA